MSASPGIPRSIWLLALLLAFPSFGFVQKYAGLAGVAAYLAAVTAGVWCVAAFGGRLAPWIKRRFRLLSIVGVCGMLVGFIVLHPYEDSKGPGKSSDRNEGLELAVERLAAGENPYYPPRVFPGPLSLFPGSILLSAPFSALGNSGYQNIFWLAAFLLAASRWFNDKALACFVLAAPFALSPAMVYEFVSGGDLISNGIFVTLFLLLAVSAWSEPTAPAWQRWGACVLLGIGLASRANFILLLPLFAGTIWRVAGFRQAVAAGSAVALSVLAVSLPFYLIDTAAFTPLMSRRKLALVNDSLPWAGTAMIALTALSSVAGAFLIRFRCCGDPARAMFRCCTLVTLVPMACAILFSSIVQSFPDFGFLRDRFGLMYLPFALFGWGGAWIANIGKPESD
ncbi:hypothetical protein HZ994_07530 [Akkermansiaceae bacterium]|nr:hypothetical protein HZ994_07530 [Akkermansiaceae bacterium]